MQSFTKSFWKSSRESLRFTYVSRIWRAAILFLIDRNLPCGIVLFPSENDPFIPGPLYTKCLKTVLNGGEVLGECRGWRWYDAGGGRDRRQHRHFAHNDQFVVVEVAFVRIE